jgi:hypothetical protein
MPTTTTLPTKTATCDCSWIEAPYLGDRSSVGSAMINDVGYAVWCVGCDGYGNPVWCCSKHDSDAFYDVTMNRRLPHGEALDCTCPDRKHRGRKCKHMVAVEVLLDEAKAIYDNF